MIMMHGSGRDAGASWGCGCFSVGVGMVFVVFG